MNKDLGCCIAVGMGSHILRRRGETWIGSSISFLVPVKPLVHVTDIESLEVTSTDLENLKPQGCSPEISVVVAWRGGVMVKCVVCEPITTFGRSADIAASNEFERAGDGRGDDVGVCWPE